jgi:hypothetical protein
MDSSSSSGILLAAQYNSCPLSSATPVYCKTEVVRTRLSFVTSVVDVALLVMSNDALYHVMLACGRQKSVLQVRVTVSFMLTVI